jgi:pilus assembly protein CpaF
MNAVDRLVASIVRSDVPLERAAVAAAASSLKSEEAPIAPHGLIHEVVDAVTGFGPIEGLLRDPDVSDVLVNGAGEVWVEKGGLLTPTDVRFASQDAVVATVRRVIAPLGLRLDRAVPAVDARLPDGSRLHAIIPPASVDGPVVAVRRFLQTVNDLDDLVERGGITAKGAGVLSESVDRRCNILVTGQTGSGKTTLLNVLCAAIRSDDRIVTIEDAAELRIDGHVVRLEAHPPNVEGMGEVTIRSLLVHALRLRPDRIVVGEVRGSEAIDMVQALNTGHAGSMSTVHANGPAEALARVAALCSLGTSPMPTKIVDDQIASAFDLVVHVVRMPEGRAVRSIHEVSHDGLSVVYP